MSLSTSRQGDLFETLKKRRKGACRAVPTDPEVLELLDMVHGIQEAQARGKGDALIIGSQQSLAQGQGTDGTAGIKDGA